MRYDLATAAIHGRSFELAREKNTTRAEARRRSREQLRTQLAAERPEEADEAPIEEPEPERRQAFKMPNVREDLRALPSIFRSKPLLLLPFALVIVGFVIALVVFALPPDIQSLALLYLQFVFTPQSLLMYFLVGFLAPRASYLVGLILGTINGFLYMTAAFLTLPPGTPVTTEEVASGFFSYTVMGALLGAFAGGFAAWYRDFLRGMQERGRQRRASREIDERNRRRDERQEARRLAKQRPST